MRRAVNHADLAAAGYFSDWAVGSGGTARFHLSTRDPAAAARVVRLDRTGIEPVDWAVVRTGALLEIQSLYLGSWLELRPIAATTGGDWSLNFELSLTAPAEDRVLLSIDDLDLSLDAMQPPMVQSWLRVRVAQSGGTLTLALEQGNRVLCRVEVPRAPTPPTIIRIGRGADETLATLNAAIGRIAFGATHWQFPPAGRPREPAPCNGQDARLIVHNAPDFATRSPRWDGSVLDPRLRAEHYDAVTLHDDDLADAGWPITHEIAIPEPAESGVYALEVAAAGETVRWPFFVTPVGLRDGERRADLVFLVPSFTYLAYADERLPPERFPWLCDDAGHRFARANRLTSLYDTHNDGSGVALASFLRPLATIRDDYRYPLCDAPHLLPVDLQLLRFLHAQGIRVDIITDAELDRDGAAILAGYRGLVTGSHPEYWTGAMLDAVEAFQNNGGHIAYLGGNGCYWVTARDGTTIEVRRGLAGIRTWSSAPGETHLAMTGEPGGLWRHRGRAEHRLLGVGLTAMGFTAARPYCRTAESSAPDYAWLFDGVGAAPIGDGGSVLGGAAGYEIDRRHGRWGSPAHSVVLATAEGFDAGYVADPDSTEADSPEPIRGEMVLTRHQSGALTFAVGSVSWCGALPEAGAMNAVGTITLNFLRRIAS